MPVLVGTRRQLLQGRDQAILFEDNFNGSSLSSMKWTITDTESKISVSGGNAVFSSGRAAPGWGDPRVVAGAIQRRAGVILDFECNIADVTKIMAIGFATSATPTSAHLIAIESGGSYLAFFSRDGENININTNFPIANATSYRFRLILNTAGWWLYGSANNGMSHNVLWYGTVGTTSVLYPVLMSYNAALTVGQVRVYRSSSPSPIVNISQAITPSLGAELLTGPDMEAFTGGLADGWSQVVGAATFEQESTIKHSGSSSQKVTGGAGFESIYQYPVVTAGQWYRASIWGYLASGIGFNLRAVTDSGAFEPYSVTVNSAVWTQLLCTFRAVGAASGVSARDFGTGDVGYADDASLKLLTLSSLVGTLQTARKEGIFERAVTVAAGYQAGFWLNWDGNTDGTEDYVEAIVDRTAGTARLSKCVAGTITNNLISAAITYSAGATLRVVRVGTSYALYYNNAQVGTTQTISDAGITNNTGFAAFETDPDASGNIVCYGGVNVA